MPLITLSINSLLRVGFYSSVVVLFACQAGKQAPALSYAKLDLPEHPNILWIVTEDLSAYIPPFGDSTIETPNLSRLAAEGVRFPNVFSPSGVCAPSRAAIATGMYPTRIGAMHMRTGPWFSFYTTDQALENYPRNTYEAVPPAGVHMHSTYLRMAGYYCTNNPKEDYQFRCEMTAWDESSKQAHWRNRAEGQPFFAIFNLDVTHESMEWRKEDDSLWIDSTLSVSVPPYLPGTEIGRHDVRRMYSNIAEMDAQVGDILAEIEDAGLLDETIIFWYTDHGGPLPRQKRTLYDSGIRVPMIIRFPHAQLAGTVDSQLISFLDFKPTLLSLAGIRPPDYCDGRAWLGPYADSQKRTYIHAAADRMDNCHDRVRAVRDKRYKYIRNYLPDQPYYLPVRYREQMPIMQELLRMRDAGTLNDIQMQWFRAQKDRAELFDTDTDPHELHNMAGDPAEAAKLQELSAECDRWIAETGDKGLIPEEEYITSIWPNGAQPVTERPRIAARGDSLFITCATEGASVGYQWGESFAAAARDPWQICQGPVEVIPGKVLRAKAHRIGYRPSVEAYWDDGSLPFTTTASGLKYCTLLAGADQAAGPGDEVLIQESMGYPGTLLFSTDQIGRPVRFTIGAGQVIDGIDEGVRGMRIGEVRKMIIPPHLSKRSEYPPNISPDSTLYYVVELVEIVGK